MDITLRSSVPGRVYPDPSIPPLSPEMPQTKPLSQAVTNANQLYASLPDNATDLDRLLAYLKFHFQPPEALPFDLAGTISTAAGDNSVVVSVNIPVNLHQGVMKWIGFSTEYPTDENIFQVYLQINSSSILIWNDMRAFGRGTVDVPSPCTIPLKSGDIFSMVANFQTPLYGPYVPTHNVYGRIIGWYW